MKKAPKWKLDEPASKSEPIPRKAKVISLETINPVKVQWLWYPYIPFGFLTNLGGDPGVGKSFITCSIAAALSRGTTLPGQAHGHPPQNVLMLSAEDPAPQVLVPRLMSMGADLKRIYIPQDNFSLDPNGIELLKSAMSQSGATIVFIDPLTAYIGGKVDIYRDNEVRAMFSPLAEAAEKTGTALIVVQHLAKDDSRKDLYKFSGSIANVAGVRSALMAQKLEDGGRVFRQVKNNLGPEGRTWRYDIIDDQFEWGPQMEPGWKPVSVSTTPRRVDEARDWLVQQLSPGPQPANIILSRAEGQNFSQRTLSTAKKGLVSTYKSGGAHGEWMWALTAQGRQNG